MTPAITGTMVAAILGLSPYTDRFGAWLRITGQAPEREDNDAMRMGRRLEPFVLDEYQQRIGAERVDRLNARMEHPKIPWWQGTPDALSHVGKERRLVEVKTVGLRSLRRFGDTDIANPTDQIPDEYSCQVRWYFPLVGLDVCDVPVLVGGQEFRLYRLHRDIEMESVIGEACKKFWMDHVEPWLKGNTNCAPEITGSDEARDYLRAKFPQHVEELAVAKPEDVDLVHSLAELQMSKKRVEEEISVIENRLLQTIGMSAGLVGEGFKLTWKAQDQLRTDWKAVANDMQAPPELIDQHTAVKAIRVFRKSGFLFKED